MRPTLREAAAAAHPGSTMFKSPIAIKPAGSYSQGRVEWYKATIDRIIRDYFNTGDLVVYDSLLRLIEFSSLHSANIDLRPTDRDISILKEAADCILLRPSNYIHASMQWGHFGEWLERLDLPVICAGAGAQAAKRTAIPLPETNLRIWRLISERCQSIGVRGAFSAEVLNDNGIKNVDVIGCPTLFRSLRRESSLQCRPAAEVRRVAYSIRREVGPDYAADAKRYLQIQKALLLRLADEKDLHVTFHGESEEKAYFYNSAQHVDDARDRLMRSGWFDRSSFNRLEHLYRHKSFFALAADTYDAFIATMDAAIGYRVHGVLPALAQGVPGILCGYDERSAELAQTLDVPLVDPSEALRMPMDELFDPVRFDRFSACYSRNFDRFAAFLEKNNINNKMVSRDPSPSSANPPHVHAA